MSSEYAQIMRPHHGLIRNTMARYGGIGLGFRQFAKRFRRITCFTAHHDIRLAVDQAGEARAHERMVVHEQDALLLLRG